MGNTGAVMTLSPSLAWSDYVVLFAALTLGGAIYYLFPKLQTRHVPGPWYTNVTGLVRDYYAIKGTRSQYVESLHQIYGPVVRISPNEVDIVDTEALKIIYNSRETFLKSQFYRRLSNPGQESLFSTVNIDFHRRHRRLLASPMSDSSLKQHVSLVRKRASQAIEGMGAEMRSQGCTDVLKWWLFMATDIIGELSFGDSFHMLEKGEKNSYIKSIEGVFWAAAVRSTFPNATSLARKLPIAIPMFKKAIRESLSVVQYATASLVRYRNLVEKDPENVPQTLFTKLFRAEDDEAMSFNEIRDDAQTYIVAGSDTTANTMTYLVWSVCQQTEIRDRLVKELRILPADYTESDLRGLTYLNHVIQETLRLHSAVPSVLPRVVPAGGKELAGYHFDEGVVVSAQAGSMHKNPKVFSEPERFNPSRWEESTQAMKDSFMPFGRGARACIGIHLAYIELRTATAAFFLAFPDAVVSESHGMTIEEMIPTDHFVMTPFGKRCLIESKKLANQ